MSRGKKLKPWAWGCLAGHILPLLVAHVLTLYSEAALFLVRNPESAFYFLIYASPVPFFRSFASYFPAWWQFCDDYIFHNVTLHTTEPICVCSCRGKSRWFFSCLFFHFYDFGSVWTGQDHRGKLRFIEPKRNKGRLFDSNQRIWSCYEVHQRKSLFEAEEVEKIRTYKLLK